MTDVPVLRYALSDPVTLTFDLVFIDGRGCQVWLFWFKPFWFYRADRRTQTVRITDADDRYTDETTVGVSQGWKKHIF